MLVNSGFESGLANWGVFNGTATLTSDAFAGSSAVSLESSRVGIDQGFSVIAGETYTLSGYAKTTESAWSGFGITLYDVDWNVLEKTSTRINGSEWAEYTVDVLAPTGASRGIVWAWKGGDTGITVVDEVTVNGSAPPPPPPPPTEGELLTNPGFEDNLDQWNTFRGSETTTTTDPFAGNLALQLSENGSGISQALDVIGGETYQLSGYAKYTGNLRSGLGIDFWDANWNRIEGYSTQITNTDWQQYQLTQDAPGNAAHATVWSWKGGDSGSAFLDALSLQVIADPPPNQLPTISSNGGAASATLNIAENSTLIADINANDADGDTEGNGLTYTLEGPDISQISINPDTGQLNFNVAVDFENPTDSDRNNQYEVDVIVSDSQGGQDSQSLTINVTDVAETPGLIGLADSQFFVDEDTGQAIITLERTDGSDGAATLFYQTLGGEAVDGQDFTGTTSATVTFADGQTTATVAIPITNDDSAEPNETFTVSLFRAEGAELGAPRTAIVTILDDDAQQGLVANYRFDDSGTTAIDSIAGNNGTLTNFGNTSRVDAPFNQGLSFDGVDDYVSVPTNAALDLSGGQFTQAVWIRSDIDDNNFHGILGYQPATGTRDRYPGIWIKDQTRIHAGFGDGTSWNAFTTGSVLTPDVWNHVATTFDGTTYRVYVNGQSVFSTPNFAGRTPINTQRFDIGRVDNYFEGDIDDVRIYNRALTPQEISTLLEGASVPPPPIQGDFVAQSFASGLDDPTVVDWLPDGRMLVVEKEGLVRVVNTDGSLESQPFIDIRDRVNSGPRDRGLIGLAVHPDFANNPYVYLSYSYDPPQVFGNTGAGGPDGNGARVARIVRVTANSATNFSTANPNSEVVLVGKNSTYENIGTPNRRPELNDPYSCTDASGNPIDDCIGNDETSHSIGDLEFGPDGYLYASVGDGGSFGRVDPINLRALDIDSLAGKILRIDPITGDGPSDNPFYNGNPIANQSRVFQYGLRNPFRIAIDQTDGDVAIGDVGWTRWEEINLGEPGANFGWPAFEGGSNGNLRTGGYENLAEVQAFYASNPDVTAPVWARNHSDGARAIVMGDFNVGDRYPDQYQNSLFFTDFGDGGVLRVATFNPDGSLNDVEAVSNALGPIVDISAGPDGYLYVTDFVSGSISRLEFQPG